MNISSYVFDIIALCIFIGVYVLVVLEEKIHLKKSIPVLFGGGVLWMLASLSSSHSEEIKTLFEHTLYEATGVFLFVLVAMTYINTMEERHIFSALRQKLLSRGYSLRQLFWITGLFAFFLSAVADNLTTALFMGATVASLGKKNERFLVAALINIVVAANAGGAFSPFGDVTTYMVWQSGRVGFFEFFKLFIPSLVNWLVPALLLSLFAFSNERGEEETREHLICVKSGGFVVVFLFGCTIALSVVFQQYLGLPPVLGMLTGLSFLKFYGRNLSIREERVNPALSSVTIEHDGSVWKPAEKPFDVWKSIKRVEWDTLLFFLGVLLAVGALNAMGHLNFLLSHTYENPNIGATVSNIFVGLFSSVVDNIPIMSAVLEMNPGMPQNEWLLVTLTAGVGGSLLSVGSAAGVALMGQQREVYTFFAHLRWTWAIALGYFASIGAHFLVNGG